MQIIGFAPDADPTEKGVVTDCDAVVPSLRGLVGAPAPVDTLLSTLPMTCQGAATLLKLDNTSRFLVGLQTSILEGSITTFSDVSQTSVAAYATVSGRWRFAQFGGISLAVSKENQLQASASSLFSAVSGAPKADIVETVNQFVFLVNTTDATYGDQPHRWWCCALSNYADWVPSIATQSATGVLTSVAGKITACRRFGDNVIIFKQYGMYFGVYSGPPFIWSFQELFTAGIGTFSQESVANIGTPDAPKLFFVGQDNFYVFDGSAPRPVGFDLKEYFFGRLNTKYQHLTCMVHDRRYSRVYVYYPSGSSVVLDSCLVYNYRTGKWGKDTRTIDFACEYLPTGITYDSLGTYYSTYTDLPVSPYDSAFVSGATFSPAIISSAHKVQTITGAASSGYLQTGDYGDDMGEYLLSRVKPKWVTKPTSATMTNYYRQSLGDTLITDNTVSMAYSRFDVLREARWHRVKIATVGDFELNQLTPQFTQNGEE